MRVQVPTCMRQAMRGLGLGERGAQRAYHTVHTRISRVIRVLLVVLVWLLYAVFMAYRNGCTPYIEIYENQKRVFTSWTEFDKLRCALLCCTYSTLV